MGSPLVAGISCCLFWRILINKHYTLRVHSFLRLMFLHRLFTWSLRMGLGHVDRYGLFFLFLFFA